MPTVGTPRRLVDVEHPRERTVLVSNRTVTDMRAPRFLDGRHDSWYLGQMHLPEQQEKTVLELDTLS